MWNVLEYADLGLTGITKNNFKTLDKQYDQQSTINSMKVFGLSNEKINQIAAAMTELEISNVRVTRTSTAFKLNPTHSDSVWARKSRQGRRLKAGNYDMWRVFIILCFKFGAKRVQTSQGNWLSVGDFMSDLPRLARTNIGSIYQPCAYISTGRHPYAESKDLVTLALAAYTVTVGE